MLFISSTGSEKKNIRESIKELYSNGFSNIELTGGTKYYETVKDDILTLRKDYGLNFLIHNYFPPPKEDFVLNLASLDDKISNKSLNFCKRAIDLSRLIDADKVSFHSGFLIDIPVNQIGNEIKKNKIFDKDKSLTRLHENYSMLMEYSDQDIDIYLENNVLSSTNAKNFNGINPFLLTDYADYCDMRKQFKFHLLIDIAHLKISSNTLHLDFDDQVKKMIAISDYLHLSDNDGMHDLHMPLVAESKLLQKLLKFNLKNKILTLEIKGDMSMLKQSYNLIKTNFKMN